MTADGRRNSGALSCRDTPIRLDLYLADADALVECELAVDGSVKPLAKPSPDHDRGLARDAALNFPDRFATEGLIDLQVNGFGGVDFNRTGLTPDILDGALVEIARTGVTSFLPTIITGSPRHMAEVLRGLDSAVSASRLGPYMVAGYHIEGPFLSPLSGYRGAHDSAHMTAADSGLIDDLQAVASRKIRIVTLAPEVDGAIELTQTLVERGIHVSMGHSAARPEQILAAVEAGARLCTHLGNGLPQMLHKTENPIFWQLAQDRLTAMFIADGIHIPEYALQTMLRAKGAERSILTTDAVSAAGRNSKPGRYTLGAAEIERSEDGSVRIPGSQYLAGSSVTMDQMVRNMVRWFGQTIPQLMTLMRRNPLRFISDQNDAGPWGASSGVVEWKTMQEGATVSRTHIGPFTVQG